MKASLSSHPLSPLETVESKNSFLVETSYNSDIEADLRIEIEQKFKKSKMNSNYVFPRITGIKKTSGFKFSECLTVKNKHKSTNSLNPYSERKKSETVFIAIHKLLQKSPSGDNSFLKLKLVSNKNAKASSLNCKRKELVSIYSQCPKVVSSNKMNRNLPSLNGNKSNYLRLRRKCERIN